MNNRKTALPTDKEISNIINELVNLHPNGNVCELRIFLIKWFSSANYSKENVRKNTHEDMSETEKDLIISTLKKYNGNIHETSLRMGIRYEEVLLTVEYVRKTKTKLAKQLLEPKYAIAEIRQFSKNKAKHVKPSKKDLKKMLIRNILNACGNNLQNASEVLRLPVKEISAILKTPLQ